MRMRVGDRRMQAKTGPYILGQRDDDARHLFPIAEIRNTRDALSDRIDRNFGVRRPDGGGVPPSGKAVDHDAVFAENGLDISPARRFGLEARATGIRFA